MLNGRPTVYIVDDDVSLRESLPTLFEEVGFLPMVFASAQEFLRESRRATPGCLILDVGLPDLNGLELQRRLGSDRDCLPIVFITGQGDIPMTVQAMKAGAIEFLTKPFSPDALLTAVNAAVERSRQALAEQFQFNALQLRHDSLTKREREVMALVIRGYLNKQVGAELGISLITVKAHRGRMMRKMQARSVADLVSFASLLSRYQRATDGMSSAGSD